MTADLTQRAFDAAYTELSRHVAEGQEEFAQAAARLVAVEIESTRQYGWPERLVAIATDPDARAEWTAERTYVLPRAEGIGFTASEIDAAVQAAARALAEEN